MAAIVSATVRVEKATSDLLMGPDWTMNMDICDSINTDHWLAKDVVKAVKKRLQNKDPKVQFLALTLLETMIKNCGDFVHHQVVEREIPQEMVKIIRKKTDLQVRDKILVLLDSWQEAFGGPGGKHPQYYWAYADLKRSGVIFPPRSADSALMFAPPNVHSAPRHPQIGYGMPGNASMSLDEVMASDMGNLSLSELDNIRSVAGLLSEMLRAVDPKDSEIVKDEVIADLVGQCQSNQKRVMQLINSTSDEQLLGEALTLNDHIQGLLAKRDEIASGSSLPSETLESLPGPSTPSAIHVPETHLEKEELEEDAEDDEFAQLARRNSKLKSPDAQITPFDDGSENTGATDTADVSIPCNALALPDPPMPIRTSSKEQEMIDLLSITLSTPLAPSTPPSATHPNVSSPPPLSPNGQAPITQPYAVDPGYNPYNTYVAPWARPSAPHPQPQEVPLASQPRPPWEAPVGPYTQPPQVSSTYPPPPWTVNSVPISSSTGYYTFSSSSSSSSPYAGGPMIGNANQRGATVTSSASTPSKPYIPSYRLFEDLVELRNPDGSPKVAGLPPTMSSNQGGGGRK